VKAFGEMTNAGCRFEEVRSVKGKGTRPSVSATHLNDNRARARDVATPERTASSHR
jgi:hypothetical protein